MKNFAERIDALRVAAARRDRMNLVDRQELRRVQANAKAKQRRRLSPKTGQPGRAPDLSKKQADQIRSWAALGRNMTEVSRNTGIPVGQIKRCIHGHKKPYRAN